MKKHLLLSAALTTMALTVSAAAPIKVGLSFQGVSKDGRFLVADDRMGTLTVIDQVKDTVYIATPPEGDWSTQYSAGLGNVVSEDGTVVGARYDGDVALFKEGKWIDLSMAGANGQSYANGITPDGSRVCGSLGKTEMTLDDVTMLVPCYWDRNEDGTYGDPVVLPHPTTDFFGRAPQYITAISISDDGKTIVGQMRDCTGFSNYPVFYYQDEEGNWVYSVPNVISSLFNPLGIDVPPYPTEPEPQYYYPADFMTPEQKEAYEEAQSNWSWGSGVPYPQAEDFMTEAELKAYEEAQAPRLAWQEQVDAHTDAMYEVLATSPNFAFNNVFVSGDGRYFAMAEEHEDPNGDPMSWMPSMIDNVWVVNLVSNELTKYQTPFNLAPSSVTADGTVFASTGDTGASSINAYVLKDGEMTELIDYLSAKDPEWAEWFTELGNVYQEVEMWVPNYETYEYDVVVEVMLYMGIPVVSADGNTICTWSPCNWYTDEQWYYYGVVYDLNNTSAGVADVETSADQVVLSLDAQGNIHVKGEVASLQVYSTSGAMVANYANPGESVESQLAKGIYLVRANCADGSVVTAKLAR